jgi:hypothetical protein
MGSCGSSPIARSSELVGAHAPYRPRSVVAMFVQWGRLPESGWPCSAGMVAPGGAGGKAISLPGPLPGGHFVPDLSAHFSA